MQNNHPGIMKMIRAPFLSSIISPIISGTLLAVLITSAFDLLNFILVFIMGICLHIATNVYNDIYDTKQGTDKINVHRNEFSGGSGVLIDYPDLMPAMYRLARIGLFGALITTIALVMRVDSVLKIYLLVLFLASAFFSKYYTAAPAMLASRGWGEVSVWFAFGPMAILVAAVSQHVDLHNIILAAMPLTGISTLSILLIGQMIDHDADKAAGKWGLAVRKGRKTTTYVFLTVQVLLCVNVMVLGLHFIDNGWPILISLIPYILFLPKIWQVLRTGESSAEALKMAAKLNVLLHLLFSAALTGGIVLTLILN